MNLFNEPLCAIDKVSCIYLITCIANNTRYVGSAISFRKRVKDHRNALKRNDHHCIYLQNCYNKHGDDFFTIEIIHSFNRIIEYKSNDYKEVLLKTEEEYIQKLNPELNTQRFPYSEYGNLGGGIPIYQYDLNGNFIRE